jgi:hypothetical protein
MEIQMDKDLQFVFQALPSFGTKYSHLVMGYCQLFGVTPFKLKAKKLRLLIEEMKRLFDAQAFSYGKNQQYKISHAGIAEALDICIKKNFTDHLENHNYLKKIMITISEREGKDQSRAVEKDLRGREQRQAAGCGRERIESPEVDEKTLSPEQIESNLTRVGHIIKSIAGGK